MTVIDFMSEAFSCQDFRQKYPGAERVKGVYRILVNLGDRDW